jgi:transposase-like protein
MWHHLKPVKIQAIENSIEFQVGSARELREHIESMDCPACKTPKNLKATLLQKGRVNWEARVKCGMCGTTGIVNQTGFQFELQTLEQQASQQGPPA